MDKVVVTLILCLRDWLMALPTLKLVREGGLDESTVKSVFEVCVHVCTCVGQRERGRERGGGGGRGLYNMSMSQ